MIRKAAAVPEPPIGVAAAATRLGISRQRVYDLINAGAIACIRYTMPSGRDLIRVEPAEITRYMNASRHAAAT